MLQMYGKIKMISGFLFEIFGRQKKCAATLLYIYTLLCIFVGQSTVSN